MKWRSSSMNVIAITGNLCNDIELRYTANNKGYVENTVAVRKEKKDENGNYESDFINFVAFEKKAEYLGRYAKKGNKVEVVGKLRVDTWKDKEGNSKSRTYVVADKVQLLTSRPKEEEAKTPIINFDEDALPF